ncbi:MAG TPA: pentapeptide repeat-containing protein [Thermoanaerobaculia bacterium]|nr:pentapeptide repeat-containing protein [Thermoanaerobaculia bacterium]
MAVKSKENPGQVRMPILIDLREGGSTTVTLENLLTHHFQRLSSQPVNPQALLHLNREGYLLLIFDGFDETIAYSEPSRYLENLRQILRAAEGKAKVLLTCRTHYFRDRPEALKRLGRVPEMTSSPGATRLYEELQERAGTEIGYVLEFREPQIEEYLKKALPPPADWQDFREQIRRTYNLNELAERPFLLEIIVKTLPRLLEKGTAISLADLYETYCQSWFDHTDFRLRLTRDKKIVIVESLARLIWDSPENRVHYTVLADRVVDLFKDRPLTGYDKEQIDYEVRTALFLHRDAEGYYSFIHRSFLEFFIARTIRAGLAAGEPGCLLLKRITREVAFFLEFWPEAKKIPALTEKTLAETYQPGISENALLLLYFHARAQLGPLVGPTRDDAIDLQRLREIFGKMRPEVIHLEGADLSGAVLAGVDLSRANLESADLTRADLRQASLNGAWSAKARLGFADLREAAAEEADLADADLSHADAQEAIFNGASLKNADLSFGRFTRAQLKAARLEGIKTIGAGMLGASLPRRTSLAATAGRTDALSELSWRFQAGHAGGVNSVSWHPGGHCVATGADDGTIKLWEPEAGRVLRTLEGHEGAVQSVAWAPDGKTIASGSDDNTVRLWDANDGRLLRTLEVGVRHGFLSMSWEWDNQRLVLGFWTGYTEIWDLTSDPPRPLARFYNTPNGSGFAVTPDGYVSGPPEALDPSASGTAGRSMI